MLPESYIIKLCKMKLLHTIKQEKKYYLLIIRKKILVETKQQNVCQEYINK